MLQQAEKRKYTQKKRGKYHALISLKRPKYKFGKIARADILKMPAPGLCLKSFGNT